MAQQVLITGHAKDFANQEAILLKQADALSGKRLLIAKNSIDEQGAFSFDLSIEETQSIIICIARMEGSLYIEPNHQYEIIFPSAASATAKRFDRTEVILDLSMLQENDLNLLIRSFNSDYIQFINDHYYDFVSDEFKGKEVYRSTLGNKGRTSDIYKMPSTNDTITQETLSSFPKEAELFFGAMKSKYATQFDNSYFKDYVRYSLAEIKLLSGLNRKLFYQEFFHAQPVCYKNPSYIKCFELFYNNVFYADLNAKSQALTKIIDGENDFEKLLVHYEADSTLLSPEVRSLAMLLNLKSSYYEKKHSRSGVIKTLDSAKTNTQHDQLKEIASNIISQTQRFEKGTIAEDFTLANLKEEKWILTENLGLTTYLFFFTTWNTASLKELILLQKLQAKYKDHIQILAINMDDDYSAYKNYVAQNRDQKFTFLFGTGDALLTEKYNVRSIPHAVMLDKEGKWISSYTKRPSEGIEEDFIRIKTANSKGNSGNKTWKDK